MQVTTNNEIAEALEFRFDGKKARIFEKGVKLNISELCGDDLRFLYNMSETIKSPVSVKRSGTGLLIVFRN